MSTMALPWRSCMVAYVRHGKTVSRQRVETAGGIRSSSKQWSTPARQFGCTSSRRAIAAPEFNFEAPPKDPNSHKLRLVPTSSSYFTTKPGFTDDLLAIQALSRRHQDLPILGPSEAPRIAWKTLAQYRVMVGEDISASRYSKITKVLQRLNLIHRSLMPEDVQAAIDKFKRDIDPFDDRRRPQKVDRNGRSVAVGRRKTSTARAWVVQGDGEVLINGKTLSNAFGRMRDRESAIWPLKATQRMDKYNVWALVSGGGTTGQAEALTLALAKALIVQEPLLKPALRRAGCVTRDPREVERKKPGKLKARKMPAWVKR